MHDKKTPSTIEAKLHKSLDHQRKPCLSDKYLNPETLTGFFIGQLLDFCSCFSLTFQEFNHRILWVTSDTKFLQQHNLYMLSITASIMGYHYV